MSQGEGEVAWREPKDEADAFNPLVGFSQSQATLDDSPVRPRLDHLNRKRKREQNDSVFGNSPMPENSFASLEALIDETGDTPNSQSQGETTTNLSNVDRNYDNSKSHRSISLKGTSTALEGPTRDIAHQKRQTLASTSKSASSSSLREDCSSSKCGPQRSGSFVKKLPVQSLLGEPRQRFLTNTVPLRNNKKRKSTIATQSLTSIVGSRPKHWDDHSKGRICGKASFANFQSRKSQLAAVFSRPITAHRPTVISPAVNEEDHLSSAEVKPPITFVPPFLAKQMSVKRGNESVDSAEMFPAFQPESSTFQLHSPSSRKSRKIAGPLVKRLKTIRDSIRGDSIRFQSGHYPFSNTPDINDPRSRAQSHLDATFLAVTRNSGQSQLLWVLGFVHSHQDKHGHSLPASDSLAWFYMSQETIHQQSISTGSALRLYNSVVVVNSDVDSSAKWLVLANQLCETYPLALCPLPSVDEIKSNLMIGV